MAGPETPKRVPWAVHAARQLKLILPGGLLTYYIGVLEEFWRTLHGLNGSLGRCVTLLLIGLCSILTCCHRTGALGAGGLGLTTVTLFIYILLIPFLTGEEPDVCGFLQDPWICAVLTD